MRDAMSRAACTHICTLHTRAWARVRTRAQCQPANSYRVAPLHKLRSDTIRLDKNRHIFSHSIRFDSPDVIHHVSPRVRSFFLFSAALVSCTINKAHIVWNWTRSCYCYCYYFYCSLPILFRSLRTMYLYICSAWCWKWHRICPHMYTYAIGRKLKCVLSTVSFPNLVVLHINRMDVIVCRHIKNDFLVQHSIGILQFNWLLHVRIDYDFIE